MGRRTGIGTSMPGRTAEKVVVVTGGAQGIGRGCAEMLAREGARVTIGDISDDRGEEVVRAIQAKGGEASFIHADVTREEQCAGLMQHAVRTFGRLDGLVNNVGWFPR